MPGMSPPEPRRRLYAAATQAPPKNSFSAGRASARRCRVVHATAEKTSRPKRRQVVLSFEEGSPDTQLRGGKGAGLVELARLGLPVPPGFTVTTTVARAFHEHSRLPRPLAPQVLRG